MSADWRDEDEVFHQRLGEERALRTLFERFAAPGATLERHDPSRGSVLVRELSRATGSALPVELAERLARGREESPRLAPPAGWSPLLVHASAVFWGRVAASWEALIERAPEGPEPARRAIVDPDPRERALESSLREALAWLALGEHPSFFSESARRVGSPEVPIDALVLGPITRQVAKARAGVATRSAVGSLGLEVLARLDDAVRRGRMPEELIRKVVERIDGDVYAVVEESLRSVADSLEAARAKDHGLSDGERHMREIAELWVWSGRSIHVETFLLREFTPIGWQFTRSGDHHATRRVLGPAIELVLSLERRILRDPMGQMAHAAGCAEVLLFWASADDAPGAYARFVERALAVCPSHRNARLQMAGLLCSYADAKVEGAHRLNARSNLQEAAALHERARGLFPSARALETTEEKLRAARARWGIEERSAGT